MPDDRTTIYLDESRVPHQWYNVVADLPSPPPPPLNPATLEPVGPDDLAPIFPADLILQEVATDRHVEAFYNARQGVRRLTTETGAGQWGAMEDFALPQERIDTALARLPDAAT
jgi:predicted alternative tryptophan synthase beta-subunit